MSAGTVRLPHLPVLYQEIISALNPQSDECYVDATLGAGGHAAGILEKSSPGGRLLGLDLDPQAIALSAKKLEDYGSRAILVQASYTTLKEQVGRLGWHAVQGIVLDLGVSSMQLDTPGRGFSFQADGPLDMRFGPEAEESAADLVNRLPEAELADLIWRYGEEPHSRRIAHAICQFRPVLTTLQLADLIVKAVGGRKGPTHPATRTFQALRIAVNRELSSLESVLPQAMQVLAPGGRFAVISFHSLEDRTVKRYFAQESRDCICPPRQPICSCGHQAILDLVNRRSLIASEAEVEENPRARSARLRIVEKRKMA
jgi:16S rRNA (cytosine1402-N4)-methyltransferase